MKVHTEQLELDIQDKGALSSLLDKMSNWNVPKSDKKPDRQGSGWWWGHSTDNASAIIKDYIFRNIIVFNFIM